MEFFSGSDLDEPPSEGTSYRALTKMTARQQGQAEGSAALALALSDWLTSRFELPLATDFPTFTGVDPERASEAVRAEWGIGERPVRNMVHLLEKHGVRVFSLAEECHEVDAFSFWRTEDVPFVFLNTMKTSEHGRMDAAHELGHLVLHRGHDVPQGREAEYEAKLFASAFLMPRGSVLASVPRGASLRQLIELKDLWGVAVSALTVRMHRLELLTDWQYRAIFKEIGKRGYRTAEPKGIPRETSQLLAKAFASLKEKGISRADIAAELHIPLEELNRSIFGLIFTQVLGGGSAVSGRPSNGTLHVVPDRLS
jgi:Zn-dependent peptidase ImmA (M78 family)